MFVDPGVYQGFADGVGAFKMYVHVVLFDTVNHGYVVWWGWVMLLILDISMYC